MPFRNVVRDDAEGAAFEYTQFSCPGGEGVGGLNRSHATHVYVCGTPYQYLYLSEVYILSPAPCSKHGFPWQKLDVLRVT